MTTPVPAISFCIPAHDEAQIIGRTLACLRAAAADALGDRPWEIVVADDGSTDDTGAIATDAGARVVRVEHRKIAAARNSAAATARGDLLFFIDADTFITATNLREAIDLLESRGCIGGGCLVRFDGRIPTWSRVVLGGVILACRTLRLSAGCFMFCTRAAFEASGGFPEAYYGSEEVHFARRLKEVGRFRLVRTPVLTSGRKLRTHSAREILTVLTRAALTGPTRVARSREALDVWYGARREDPG